MTDNLVVEITNFLAIAAVEIPLDKRPTAVLGPNASGKTSISTALAGILSRDPNPLELGAARRPYLHRGAEDGEVVLRLSDTGAECRRWIMSETGIRAVAGGPPDASKHVLGMTDFVDLKPAERTRVWESCFLPSNKELVAMVGEDLKKQIGAPDVVDKVLGMLRTRKWSDVETVYKHQAREAKAEWQGLAGRNWGKVVAEQWKPHGWRSDLDTVTQAESRTRFEEQRETLRVVQIKQAVQESDVSRAQEALAELPNLEKEHATLAEACSRAKSAYADADRKLASIKRDGLRVRDELQQHDNGKPERDETTPCPSCGKALVVGPGTHLTMAQDTSAFATAVQAWSRGRETLADRLDVLRKHNVTVKLTMVQPAKAVLDRATAAYQDITSRLGVTERQAKLATATVRTEEDQRRQAAAEQAIDDARRAVEMIDLDAKARQIHQNILSYSAIAVALGPRGIRAMAMSESMGQLQITLEDLSGSTSWPKVALDSTYAVSIDDFPGPVCAASWKWRANVMIQAAIALMQGEPRIVADGADILDHKGFRQFIALCNWLAGKGVVPVVCATATVEGFPPEWNSVHVSAGVVVE